MKLQASWRACYISRAVGKQSKIIRAWQRTRKALDQDYQSDHDDFAEQHREQRRDIYYQLENMDRKQLLHEQKDYRARIFSDMRSDMRHIEGQRRKKLKAQENLPAFLLQEQGQRLRYVRREEFLDWSHIMAQFKCLSRQIWRRYGLESAEYGFSLKFRNEARDLQLSVGAEDLAKPMRPVLLTPRGIARGEREDLLSDDGSDTEVNPRTTSYSSKQAMGAKQGTWRRMITVSECIGDDTDFSELNPELAKTAARLANITQKTSFAVSPHVGAQKERLPRTPIPSGASAMPQTTFAMPPMQGVMDSSQAAMNRTATWYGSPPEASQSARPPGNLAVSGANLGVGGASSMRMLTPHKRGDPTSQSVVLSAASPRAAARGTMDAARPNSPPKGERENLDGIGTYVHEAASPTDGAMDFARSAQPSVASPVAGSFSPGRGGSPLAASQRHTKVRIHSPPHLALSMTTGRAAGGAASPRRIASSQAMGERELSPTGRGL